MNTPLLGLATPLNVAQTFVKQLKKHYQLHLTCQVSPDCHLSPVSLQSLKFDKCLSPRICQLPLSIKHTEHLQLSSLSSISIVSQVCWVSQVFLGQQHIATQHQPRTPPHLLPLLHLTKEYDQHCKWYFEEVCDIEKYHWPSIDMFGKQNNANTFYGKQNSEWFMAGLLCYWWDHLGDLKHGRKLWEFHHPRVFQAAALKTEERDWKWKVTDKS